MGSQDIEHPGTAQEEKMCFQGREDSTCSPTEPHTLGKTLKADSQTISQLSFIVYGKGTFAETAFVNKLEMSFFIFLLGPRQFTTPNSILIRRCHELECPPGVAGEVSRKLASQAQC